MNRKKIKLYFPYIFKYIGKIKPEKKCFLSSVYICVPQTLGILANYPIASFHFPREDVRRTYKVSDDIWRNKILGKLQGQSEMPQGLYLKDGKHNAKICKIPFLYIVYIYIYMLFSNIINTVLKLFFFTGMIEC